MPVYELYSNQPYINWNAQGKERILQNVINLLNLIKHDVAYDRTLGLSPDLIDATPDFLRSKVSADVIELIHTYEPRAKILEVSEISAAKDDNDYKVVVEI